MRDAIERIRLERRITALIFGLLLALAAALHTFAGTRPLPWSPPPAVEATPDRNP